MAATLKVPKHVRSWNIDDSYDTSDVVRLFETENVKVTKPRRFINYWTVYLALIGFFALFFIGILVGFYLRADPKVLNECVEDEIRLDGLDDEQLQSVHNNIMNFMSADSMKEYNRKISSISNTNSEGNWDELSARYVKQEFQKFGLVDVEIQEHEFVVTSPDPDNPNRLEILHPGGATEENVTVTWDTNYKGENSSNNKAVVVAPHVAFSPPGKVKGPLLYGNYGSHLDFLILDQSNISLVGSVVLLRMGKIPVAEKVYYASQSGAVGVLLFCHPDDQDVDTCNHDDWDGTPYASAADWTGYTKDVLPRIPIQTVSTTIARKLLQSQHTTSLPTRWLEGVENFLGNLSLNRQQNTTEPVIVSVSVNSKAVTKKVYNVVGTLLGSEEKDRYTMVSAGRYTDDKSGTTMLLELCKRITYVRDTEGWAPRRSVKFLSWGGSSSLQAGLHKYIQANNHILEQEAVTFIDLDLHTTGSDVTKYVTSPALVQTVMNAAAMVPDPLAPDLSLADSWPKLSPDWVWSNQSRVHIYGSQSRGFPMLQQLGIPTVYVQSAHTGNSEVAKDLSKRGITHHSKDQLSTARVISRVLLSLVDGIRLPLHVEMYTEFLLTAINQSVTLLRQATPLDISKIEYLKTAIENLSEAGKRFTDLKHSKCLSPLKLRQINDLLMHIDSMFVGILGTNSNPEYLFTTNRLDGMLTIFSDAIEEYKITNNLEQSYKTVVTVTDIVNKASEEIAAVVS